MADRITDTHRFRLDLVNHCLWRSTGSAANQRVKLTPKTFDVLRYLVEQTGRLVTHDELLRVLWRDVHVQPEVLKSHILAIRTALGDKAGGRQSIETERGRGYRFVGPIDMSPGIADQPREKVEPGSFAGRNEPLQALMNVMRTAMSGECQAVFMSGEPGIGKTALIRQFLARMADCPGLVVAKGQCIESFAGAEPYYPVLEALGSLCREPADPALVQALLTMAPTWAAQLPAQVFGEQRAALRLKGSEGPRSTMLREACTLFDALAKNRPLILVLEDLHWADYATIDLLSAICRRGSAAKLMLIATYRQEDLKSARHPLIQMTRELAVRSLCHEVTLKGLSEAEIADLLTGGSDCARLPDEFSRRMKEQCGGNPLFIRITLDYLVDQQLIERTTLGWRLLVPADQLRFDTAPNLSRLIVARLEALPGDQRRAVEAASVMGVRFDPAGAASAAGMDQLSFEATCDELSGCDSFISPSELTVLPNYDRVRTYVFQHAVLQQVCYSRIGESRRAGMHRAVGERLEDLYPADKRDAIAMQLAQHFARARDWPRALRYLRSALHVATLRLARRDALAILDCAVELAANLPESARTSAELEFLERRAALLAASHDAEAQQAYESLVVKAARHGDISAQARGLLGLSYVLSWRDSDLSLRSLEEVLLLSESLTDPIEQDAARVTAYSRRVWGAGWNREDARRCEAAFDRLKRVDDKLTVARAQISFSMMCILSTRYRESLDLVDGGYLVLRETSEGSDLARWAWMRHVGVPWALFSLGEYGAALEAFDASVTAYQSSGDDAAAQSLTIYRGVLLFHALDYEGLLEACGAAASELTELPAGAEATKCRLLPLEQRISLIFCGLGELGLGRPAAAVVCFRVAEEKMALQKVHLDWYWRLALEWGWVQLHLACGDIVAAELRAERFCELALQTDERAWQALALDGRARVALARGDTEAATDFVLQALAVCEGASIAIAEWRVHATASAVFYTVKDRNRADTHARLSTDRRQELAKTFPLGHPMRAILEQGGVIRRAVRLDN